MTSHERSSSPFTRPSTPPSSSSSSVSLSTLSPTSRARIAEKRRLAQERLSRKRLLDSSASTKAQSQRLLQYLTPAPTRTPHDVIVLDDDPFPLPPPHPPQRLSSAEREERRYDPRDDGTEGDVEATEGKATAANLSSVRGVSRASVRPRVQPSVPQSSRQGGSEHYQLLRSSGIGESSFTHAFPPLPLSAPRARNSLPPLPPFASSPNPFSIPAQPEPAQLTSADPPWRSKATDSPSSSSPYPRAVRVGSEMVSPYFEDVVEDFERRARAEQPVPPHREHELWNEEEKQIWGLFDQARRRTPPVSTYSSHASSPTLSDGRGKRSMPLGMFDSPAVRLEERQERKDRKRKKEHPLLEERRMAKRLRASVIVGAGASSSSHSHRPPVPPPLPPPPPPHHPPASTASLPPKSTRKTQLLVDPRVAAVESQRQQRQAQVARDRLTQQRLKPSLDELHAAVLSWSPFQLDGAVKTALQKRFTKVPLTFADDVEYQQVFYPLLLEECRSEMVGAIEELEGTMEERGEEQARAAKSLRQAYFDPAGLLEVVAITSYHQVNAFHHIDVERVDFSSSSKLAPLFINDDLVLLWYRPSSSDPFEVNEWKSATLYTLARLERVHDKGEGRAKGEKRKRGIRYKLQVHAQPGGDSEVNVQKLLSFLLKTSAQWGVVKVLSLITLHRQYRALESCALLPLFPWLKDPSSVADHSKRRVNTASTFRQFPSSLTSAFNVSQQEAMATALEATDGITLIQGPPGTGKTRTIVGLINLLLVQSHATTPHHHHTSTPSSSSSSSSLRTSPVPPAAHRILICAPSNAAIDEIVVRFLQPDALHDAKGHSLRPRIVRVGAGKRHEDRDVAKSQHNGMDVDAVSLDALVAARMRERGESEEKGEDARYASKKVEGEKKDAAFYDAALVAVKEQLDEVHQRLADLEEKAAQDARVAPADPNPSSSSPAQASVTAAEEDLRKQIGTAHRQRKGYLAERKRLQEKKDEFFQQQRRAQQAAIDNRDLLRLSILNESNLVCTTLTGAGLELFTQSTAGFDCVIIDEAAQAIELQTLIPLKYECTRFVLVGDDRQLSATVISTLATRYDYQQSLFSRLRKCGVQVQVIQIQYRMHPDIRRFPSRYFYNDALQDAEEVLRSDAVQRHPALLHPLPSVPLHLNRIDQRIAPYVFYDVKGVESRAGHASLHNIAEARVAVELFKLILRAHPARHADLISRVGVITPYQQQVSTLRRLFRDHFTSDPSLSPLQTALEVSTVDSFQGREKDFIIFSAVRAHQHEGRSGGRGGIGFVADANRLNVALTRARVGLFVLGSARTLSKEEVWRRLIEDARERERVVEVGDDVKAVFRDPPHHARWAKELDPAVWSGKRSADGGIPADRSGDPPTPGRKIRRSLSSSPSTSAQPSPSSSSANASSPIRRPTAVAIPGKEAAAHKEARQSGLSSSAAPAAVKKTQPLPLAAPSAVPSSSPVVAPGLATVRSSSSKPPSPSSLNGVSISSSSSTTKRIPRIQEERKDRPPSSSEKAAAKPHSSSSAAPAGHPPSSASLHGLDLNALMKSAVSPTAGMKGTANINAGLSSPAPPPPNKPTSATQQTPLAKPKRTLSSVSASPSNSSVASASPPPAKPSPQGVVPRESPSSSVSFKPLKPSADADIRSSSSASASATSVRRSPSVSSPSSVKDRKVRRQRSREEIDITASAVQDSEDDVVITASHVVAQQAAAQPEDGELVQTPPSSPHPFLETERGSVRTTLPAYSCPDCKAFHRLMDEGRLDEADGDCPGRYRPQTFEVACNHRMRQSATAAIQVQVQGVLCATLLGD